MNFQDNLKKYREKAGYSSAKDFAKLLGVPYTTYMGYENKGSEPKYDLLIKIAEILGVTTDELLGYKPDAYKQAKRILERALFKVEEKGDGFILLCMPLRNDGTVKGYSDNENYYLPLELEGREMVCKFVQQAVDETNRTTLESLNKNLYHSFLSLFAYQQKEEPIEIPPAEYDNISSSKALHSPTTGTRKAPTD